eukprot:Sspe_Gene.66165::Locus_39112_Transcript_1_1_Confidence_1.000_Length_2836::g.66165::m.66165
MAVTLWRPLHIVLVGVVLLWFNISGNMVLRRGASPDSNTQKELHAWKSTARAMLEGDSVELKHIADGSTEVISPLHKAFIHKLLSILSQSDRHHEHILEQERLKNKLSGQRSEMLSGDGSSSREGGKEEHEVSKEEGGKEEGNRHDSADEEGRRREGEQE